MKNCISEFKDRFLLFFGIDSLIFYSSLAKILQGIGLLALLLTVNTYLDEIQRGFYFSFSSLIALQIFFELGIGVVVLQNAARLIVSYGGNLDSNSHDVRSYKDIIGLYQFNLVWTILAGALLFLIIFPFGKIFFTNIVESALVSWQSEWLILCISVAIFLPLSAQLSFFEGAGYLKEVLKLRVALSFLSYINGIIALMLGYGLYAIAITFMTQIFLILVWLIIIKHHQIFLMFQKLPTFKNLNYWFNKLLPMQWKIALSWICGYIAFQTATPITLSYFGAGPAGEIGLFLTISNMFVGFMGAWMSTKIPIFSKLIEEKKIQALNNLFYNTIKKSSLVFFIISIFLYVSSQIYFTYAKNDFMTTHAVVIFIIISGLTSISFAQAVYLRSFLKELFVPSSLTYAFLVIFLLPFMISLYGLNGLLASFLVAGLISTTMTTIIFLRFKNNITI